MAFTTSTQTSSHDELVAADSTLQNISMFVSRVIVIVLTTFSALALAVILMTSSTMSRLTHIEGFEVTSGSMSPVFDSGSIVVSHLVSLEQARSLQVGDIVTFKAANNSEKLITHRIVEVQNPGTVQAFYTTKGDANQSVDLTHLTPEQVVGTYKTSVPLMGHIIEAMHRFQIVGLFAVALIFAYISMATNKKNNNKEEITK